MKFFIEIILFLSVIGIAFLYKFYSQISKSLPVPELDINEYWGPGLKEHHKDDKSIRSYKISYSNDVIDDLKQQLNRKFRYHEPLEGIGFQYGFNSKKLNNIIKFWRDDYLLRWRERENYLNKFQHFTTEIQGLKIHYINQKPDEIVRKSKKVFPVLLLHGWPGSVREFYDIIPKFTTDDENSEYVFEVIAPSLPGYGWSQGSSKTGFGPAQIAVVLRNLMIRLGHEKFFIQGGDWGAIIGSYIATLFPNNVIGYHTNLCMLHTPIAMLKLFTASLYPSLFVEKEYEKFYFPIMPRLTTLIEESGYFHLQATKPDTIGIALSDNPIGLAAYILEKFSTATNKEFRKLSDGGLEKHFTMDSLLDNIMIYHLTNSITTAVRLYAEGMSTETRSLNLDRVPALPLSGCVHFLHDIGHSFDWQLKDKYPNLIHSTYYQNGGHFVAMEVPNDLYQDFVTFVKKVVVKVVENAEGTRTDNRK